MSAEVETPHSSKRDAIDACESCRWAGTCVPLADLHALQLNRPGLEAEFGWDVFGFMAEARRQYRKARASGCCRLPELAEQARQLAPYVDFERLP